MPHPEGLTRKIRLSYFHTLGCSRQHSHGRVTIAASYVDQHKGLYCRVTIECTPSGTNHFLQERVGNVTRPKKAGISFWSAAFITTVCLPVTVGLNSVAEGDTWFWGRVEPTGSPHTTELVSSHVASKAKDLKEMFECTARTFDMGDIHIEESTIRSWQAHGSITRLHVATTPGLGNVRGVGWGQVGQKNPAGVQLALLVTTNQIISFRDRLCKMRRKMV